MTGTLTRSFHPFSMRQIVRGLACTKTPNHLALIVPPRLLKNQIPLSPSAPVLISSTEMLCESLIRAEFHIPSQPETVKYEKNTSKQRPPSFVTRTVRYVVRNPAPTLSGLFESRPDLKVEGIHKPQCVFTCTIRIFMYIYMHTYVHTHPCVYGHLSLSLSLFCLIMISTFTTTFLLRSCWPQARQSNADG